MKQLRWAALGTAMLLFGSTALAGGTFEIIEGAGLHWFPGTAFLSQDGKAMSGNLVEPFYWTEDGGYQTLPPGQVKSIGRISGDGSRIALEALGLDGYWAPATWSPSAGFEIMDLVPGAIVNPNYYGGAYDLNFDGTMGTGLTWLSNTQGSAFLWTEGVGSVALNSSGNSTRGTGISGDGSTVVGFDEHPVAGYRRAAIWVDGVGPQLIAGADAYGECYDATFDGFAVCGTSDLIAGVSTAFYWDQEIGYIDIGALSGHQNQGSTAMDISDNLNVVGYSSNIHFGAPRAFIWNRTIGLSPLSDFLVANDVVGYDGQYLYSATGISGDGKVIVGNYQDIQTYYWGMFRVVLDSPVTSVDDDPSSLPAATTALLGAHPNPFNPMTTVSFNLERDQHVDLAVYDMTGRHVVDLVSRVFTAGGHSVTWQGRNAQGQGVPSGTYLLRMDTAGSTSTSKVMLVR